MKSIKDKLLNILLFPRNLFEKLTDKKSTLYAGILLVGAIDLLLPDVAGSFKLLFTNKPVNSIYFNAVMMVLIIAALGGIDVLFIGLPLFDFFKFLKKKEIGIIGQDGLKEGEHIIIIMNKAASINYTATAVKVMKVYIMSHFIIIPVNTIAHYAFFNNIAEPAPVWVQNLALVYFMAIFIWSAAIMARGVNTLFRFSPIFTKLTFIIVFAWNFLFGMVFDLQIMNWLTRLFR